ncbi:MAG: RNase J family beta-CASP ribonuclease [Clostridiaceae bacterium]|nr:RNase J family beta-CASP ribonuclease [Clostridiaceae bacterium]
MAKNNQPKPSKAEKRAPAKKRQVKNDKTVNKSQKAPANKTAERKRSYKNSANPSNPASKTKQTGKKANRTKQTDKKANTQRRNTRTDRKPKPEIPIKITFLGGLNEVGKNMTLYECQGDMILVDCGLAFPDPDMLGVDLVIPDFSYAVENADKIKGIFITHGHEDHIGGLAYLLKEMNIPVYSTRLTIGLIEGKLKEHGLLDRAKLNVVNPGDKVNLGCFEVELIHVNHSIPDAVALAIKSPAGVIVQTGDFKIDTTPIDGGVIDMARLSELGSQGVLCLLSDSTNAEKPGFTESESKVGESFERLFARAEGKRLIVATFASNIHRVQQIINEAHKLSRKVALSGRSLENVVSIAAELGYINIPDDTLIGIDSVKRYPDDKIVVITTGSQGEPMSALYRMAFSEHRKIDIGPNDFVIISATPIPGNERMVGRVVDELLKLGAEVVYERMYEVHVSGHACQEELKIMMSLTKPKYFIPVHGEQKHLRKHAGLAYSMGIEPQNVIIADNGRVVEVSQSHIKTVGEVQSGMVFVDGSGVGDVGSVVLRDRTKLAEEGIVIIAASYETETCTVVSGPDVITRGFVYVKESEEFLEKTRRICENVLADCMYENVTDYLVIKNRLRDAVSRFIYEQTRRSPVVLPIIMEV